MKGGFEKGRKDWCLGMKEVDLRWSCNVYKMYNEAYEVACRLGLEFNKFVEDRRTALQLVTRGTTLNVSVLSTQPAAPGTGD